MRVALDAMGGDDAPGVVVDGAVEAVRTIPGLSVILVGDEEVIRPLLAAHGIAEDHPALSLFHADEVIGMDEAPSVALRQKKKSSIHVGAKLVKQRAADAFVSAGNTGAVMAVASVVLRTLEGIDRAGIAVPLPNNTGGLTVLLDAGANVSVKPGNLYQFGVMGAMYARHFIGVENPRVGLLSIGEEESKGNDTIREAHELMTRSSLNFIGNVEGKLLYKSYADVAVCDGFTGNIALKVSESVAGMITGFLKEMFAGSWRGKIAYLLLKKDLEAMKRRIDHAEVGGAPLLGIDGAVFISHGSSDARAIRFALAAAKKFIDQDVNGFIRQTLAENRGLLEVRKEEKPPPPPGVWDRVRGIIGLGGDEKKTEGDL
ncbi:MAG: phosphate acyltransferase PlsX [Nitrospinae bacterium]|nr:phosphate acyltransferase PlsX [Nitrospinota bacterium]